MNIKSLKLRGFKGIKAGMCLDEIFLDLAALPEGLIAITGENGAGKTTIMDNLTPYRLMPYKIRKSPAWSPGAFSFYDQCFGADALKELCFEMGGIDYRALVLIDSDKRKQECYLYRREDGQWVPVNDGKSRTYDEAIEKVCGSPQLFFTSVYRCQSARNLSDYTRSDIMNIISELLNIDRIKEQGEKCRAVVAGLSAGLDLTRDRMVILSAEVEAVDGLSASIADKTSVLDIERTNLVAARASLDETRCTVATLREQQAAQAASATLLNLLRTQEYEERQRLEAGRVASTKAITDLDRRIADTTSVLDRAVLNIQTRVIATRATGEEAKASLRERIARAEKIISGADAIRKAVVDEARAVIDLSTDRDGIVALQVSRDGAFRSVSEQQVKMGQLKVRLDACRKDSSKLDGLDCRNDESGWLNPTCRFISDAVVGRDALPALETEYGALIEDCSAAQSLAVADQSLKDLRTKIQAAEVTLAEYQKFTRLLPELEQAEANVTVWTEQLAGLDVQTAATVAEFDADVAALQKQAKDGLQGLGADKWSTQSEWDISVGKMNDRIAELRRDIDAFPVSEDLSGSLRDLAISEGVSLTAVAGFETRIRQTELDLAALQTKLESAQAKSGEVLSLQEKERGISAQAAKFTMLMKACGNSGIIALEIDDSGSGISAIANELLASCYGSRFSIRFDTQQQKQDGDMKEVFDVIVYDAEIDESRSLTELSGGQCAWINDALTRAICLFNIHASGKSYGTLFVDEVDGALDAERKLEFFAIKRKALELGSHSREIFISQSPELIELADSRIMLSRGGISIC